MYLRAKVNLTNLDAVDKAREGDKHKPRREEVTVMWLSYEESQLDEETLALADEISALIVGANVTYKKAMEALERAQRLIKENTKPIKM